MRAAIEKMPATEPLAWLLLASYAVINDILEPVTNEHEQQFQLRLFAALRAGELGYG